MTKLQNLVIIREHIKDGIEGHRKRLSDLWERGRTDTWIYKRLKEQYDLMQTKLDIVQDDISKLVPAGHPPIHYRTPKKEVNEPAN